MTEPERVRQHSRTREVSAAYWERVVASDFAVPTDRSLIEHTVELVDLLASPDAHLRDALACEVLATWVRRGVYDDLLPGLGDGMGRGLAAGLGDRGTDSVFRRSYSAVVLTAVLERDNTAHLLHPDVVLRWGDRGLHWFLTEQDLRGWAGAGGWAHVVSHGADLLAALARSRHLDRYGVGVVLDSLLSRLERTDGWLLRHGEEVRLAYATMAALQREPLDDAGLRAVFERAAALGSEPLDGARADTRQNVLAWLRELHTQVLLGVRAMPWYGDGDYFAEETPRRERVIQLVREALRAYAPAYYRAARS
ncbi:MAG: DUF2785 domain-containing protein [Actinomycetota bacterium]